MKAPSDLKELADRLRKSSNADELMLIQEVSEMKRKLEAWTDDDDKRWEKQFSLR